MELVDKFTCPADKIEMIQVKNLDLQSIEIYFEEIRQDILVEVWGNPQTTDIFIDYEKDGCLEVRREPHTRKHVKVTLHMPVSFQRNERRKTFTLVNKS